MTKSTSLLITILLVYPCLHAGVKKDLHPRLIDENLRNIAVHISFKAVDQVDKDAAVSKARAAGITTVTHAATLIISPHAWLKPEDIYATVSGKVRWRKENLKLVGMRKPLYLRISDSDLSIVRVRDARKINLDSLSDLTIAAELINNQIIRSEENGIELAGFLSMAEPKGFMLDQLSVHQLSVLVGLVRVTMGLHIVPQLSPDIVQSKLKAFEAKVYEARKIESDCLSSLRHIAI